MFKLVMRCFFSPRLFKIYGQGPEETFYEPYGPEKIANKILSTAQTVFNCSIYTSPFICMYIYKRGFFSWDEARFLSYVFGGLGCFIAFTYFMRAIGRASNPGYVDFLNNLNTPSDDQRAYLERIRKYDFEFYAWVPSFKMEQLPSVTWFENIPFVKCANPDLPYYQKVTIQILAYIAIHTFALSLIYPGTLTIIENMLWQFLAEGRAFLVETYNGKRAKIITADGNSIDTMFVDNRLDSSKGNILVICSEGNSGFYEIGIMTTPINAGYSALGWNHPGFGGSTGTPYPRQEQNAIDAVIQYAINELEFEVEDIVLFGWSIGGYTTTWAAINYPDVKGIILDACFDDLLPLAQNQMPKSWNLLVKEVVRSFVNLNIAEMLSKYSGPVQLVRRTEDEVICIKANQLASNRGNFLLISLLQQRHPELFEEESEKPVMDVLQACVALSDQQRIVMSCGELPAIKRKILPMISRYMRDFRSTHCTALPEDQFTSIMEAIING
ncbi:phosphatidylserine lipase ABHD16A [Vanessa atalanta]|uniref:phosphatidylserine lipase ABHD16A n=1 Tax=Vanessa atalanta TaxID=42275 RepID=UPI001FCCC80C|nr:phosphatidylserine lipase ABHD16A [Vanessa atalanta]